MIKRTFVKHALFTLLSALFFYTSTFGYQMKSITILAHGLGGNPESLRYYQQQRVIIGDAYAFQLYDSPTDVSFGQHHELNNLDTAINKIKKEKPYNAIILRGISMGASTIVNYLGSYHPLAHEIKGAILESPYADTKDVAHLLKELAAYYNTKNHDLSGIQPIKDASLIPKDLPILLIATKKDTVVPISSTERIYTELIKSGHTKTHILIINDGHHANVCWDNNSSTIVRNVEHAFRKKYELGNYNETYAQTGEEAFAQTQPLV